jgi:hypothetical protein
MASLQAGQGSSWSSSVGLKYRQFEGRANGNRRRCSVRPASDLYWQQRRRVSLSRHAARIGGFS